MPLEVSAPDAPEVRYHGERGRGEDGVDAVHPPVKERKEADVLVSLSDCVRMERTPGMLCRQVQVVPPVKEESGWALVDEGVPGISAVDPVRCHSFRHLRSVALPVIWRPLIPPENHIYLSPDSHPAMVPGPLAQRIYTTTREVGAWSCSACLPWTTSRSARGRATDLMRTAIYG